MNDIAQTFAIEWKRVMGPVGRLVSSNDETATVEVATPAGRVERRAYNVSLASQVLRQQRGFAMAIDSIGLVQHLQEIEIALLPALRGI